MTVTVLWAAAIVIFMILELSTVGLTSIWFAIGSLCALISALLGAPVWLQIVWFVIISVAALLLTRPLVKKYINEKTHPTNADRVIGMVGVVTEKIDNLAASGQILVGGNSWTARSDSGLVLQKGERVRVLRIEGVKVYVAPESESDHPDIIQ